MFARILSMVQEKLRKLSPQREAPTVENLIEDPIAEFVIQIDGNGDFAIGVECFSTEQEHASFMGMTLYLLNSGMLSDYFVEALRLDSEEDEDKLKFAMSTMRCWKDIYDKDGVEGLLEAPEHKDAVNPKDVFSFHMMRP